MFAWTFRSTTRLSTHRLKSSLCKWPFPIVLHLAVVSWVLSTTTSTDMAPTYREYFTRSPSDSAVFLGVQQALSAQDSVGIAISFGLYVLIAPEPFSREMSRTKTWTGLDTCCQLGCIRSKAKEALCVQNLRSSSTLVPSAVWWRRALPARTCRSTGPWFTGSGAGPTTGRAENSLAYSLMRRDCRGSRAAHGALGFARSSRAMIHKDGQPVKVRLHGPGPNPS